MKLLMNFHTCDVIRVTSQLTATVMSRSHPAMAETLFTVKF